MDKQEIVFAGSIVFFISLFIAPVVGTPSYEPPRITELAISDIDGDSVAEIIAFLNFGGNFVIDSQGNMRDYQGEPIEQDLFIPLPLSVDVDGDGAINKVTRETCNVSTYNVHSRKNETRDLPCIKVYEQNGSVKWYHIWQSISMSTVVDLDGDGVSELIITDGGNILVVEMYGNKRFIVNPSSISSKRSFEKEKREERLSSLKTLTILAAVIFLYIVSARARKVLKPNKFNVGTTIFLGLLIPLPIGFFPVPMLILLPLSIIATEPSFFSISAIILLGIYLYSSTISYILRVLHGG